MRIRWQAVGSCAGLMGFGFALGCIGMVLSGCTGGFSAGTAQPQSLAVFDFESDTADAFALDTRFAATTSDPAEVIDGKRSLVLDTLSSDAGYHDLFYTLPDGLKLDGGKRYKLQFRYTANSPASTDAYFYFSARSQSNAAPEQIHTKFRECLTRPSSHYKNMILPGGVDDYRIHFGIVGKGRIVLDNITLSRLPDFDLAAEGVPVKDNAYEPYGICTHFTWVADQGVAVHPDRGKYPAMGYTDQQVLDGIQMLKDAGVQWFRADAAWAHTELEKGQYCSAKLDRLDLVIDQAQAAGLKPYVLLFSNPRWASSRPEDKDFWAYAPKDQNDWAHYVTFIAQRYKGRIHHWEIGNEIDWEFWRSDMAAFAEYLKTAYKALKRVDPKNKVIMSGLAFDGTYVWDFHKGAEENALQKLYDAGVKDYFDIFAIHPYAHVRQDHTVKSIDAVNNAYAIMCANGDGDKPFWITELGASSHDLGGEIQQAEYLRNVYSHILKHPKIEKIFWYNFRCTAVGGAKQDTLGIVNNTDLSPKEAYKMYQTMPKQTVRKINPGLLAR